MNISVCITVLNEEKSIGALLDSLLVQTQMPDEVIIVDGGSGDKTIEMINHYQKRDGRIKLLKEKCSRARGRNLGIEIAKGEVIATIDAGCAAHSDWLERLTAPFLNTGVDVSAGFYRMVGKTSVQRAMGQYLGIRAAKFDVNFLPSTRSMAFTKKIWERVGGFSENVKDAAEDTVFNYNLIKTGARFSRMKNAVVEWGMPINLNVFFWKIFAYAKGDAKSRIWYFPKVKQASHNIKALFIVLRYLVGFVLLILSFWYPLLPYLVILIFLYLLWAFRKVYMEFGDYRVAIWGPILQIAADLGVITGFLSGLLS